MGLVALHQRLVAPILKIDAIALQLAKDGLCNIEGGCSLTLTIVERQVAILYEVASTLPLQLGHTATRLVVAQIHCPLKLLFGPLLLRLLPLHKGASLLPKACAHTLAHNLIHHNSLVDVHNLRALLDEYRTLNLAGNQRNGIDNVANKLAFADGVFGHLRSVERRFEGDEIFLIGGDILADLVSGVATRKGVGVLTLGQYHDPHIESLFKHQIDTLNSRLHSGTIAIEEESNIVCETRDDSHLLNSQGCTQWSYNIFDTLLVELYNINISLHEDTMIFASYGTLGKVDTVEVVALGIDHTLGRVEILGLILAIECPATKCRNPSRNGVNREHNPTTKAVVISTRFALNGEARIHKELLLIARFQGCLCHCVLIARGAALGAVSKAEAFDCCIGKPARGEVSTRHTQPLVGVVHLLHKVVCRPRIGNHHTLPIVVAPLLLGGLFALLDSDAILLGHPFEGLGIGQLLVLHNEGHSIATLATSETLVESLGGRNYKRWGFLIVERTTSHIVHPLLFE